MLKKFIKPAILGFAAVAVISCSQEEDVVIDDNTTTNQLIEVESTTLSEEVGSSETIPGQYIVVYNKSIVGDFGKTTANYRDAKEAVVNLTSDILGMGRSVTNTIVVNAYAKTIMGVTVQLNEAQLNTLRGDKRVSFIEQDRIVQFAPPCGTPNGGPCDPGDGGGGDGGSGTQETPWGIARVNGVASYTGNGVAWILDSGIDLDHPDLNVNASRGYNAFTSGKDGRSMDDGNGHGTHVAGTIAALNNSTGVIGVAPGASVIPVKVLDSRGSGSYSGVVAGVDHVAANGSNGDVANMSLGGPISPALDAAILAAGQSGVKFMLAAGNEAQDTNNTSPGRVNGNNIYTISAMSQGDNWASFSNFSNPPIDFCAPGVAVKSTWKSGGYNTISGTSMATPHAAGVMLLGAARTDGTVNGDPDGTPDAIIIH